MYYQVKVKFDTETEQGKRKVIKELYLVEANSPTEAEKKAKERFKDGVSEMRVESIIESKILGIIR